VNAMQNQHILYNDTIEYISNQEKEKKIFVIQPIKELPVKRTEKSPDKLLETYEIGRQTAMESLSDLIFYLGE